MKQVSGAELSALTGKAWRTCKRRLDAAGVTPLEKRGAADLFDSVVALSAIYATDTPAEGLDLTSERARLACAQADLAQLDLAEQRGELVRAADVLKQWQTTFASVRARLLLIPSRLAARAYAGATLAEVEAVITAGIHEALIELAADE